MAWENAWADFWGKAAGHKMVDGVRLAAASPVKGAGLDPQLDGFRSLWGRGDISRDLLPLEHDEMLRMADHLATRNPMARRIVNIFKDMTLGDNLTYDLGKEATDPLKDHVAAFWSANDMDNRPARWAEGISRHGERIIPVTADVSGRVRIGFIHPGDIRGILYDRMDDLPRTVVVKDSAEQEGIPLSVVREFQEEDSDRPPGVDAGTSDGQVFYFYVNRSEGQSRGISDLLPFGDWLDALDELMFVGMDRAKTSLHVFFDVTLEGMQEAEIMTWLSNAKPPKPGTLRAHNELVTWEIKSPDLASAEIHQLYRSIKEHIVGCIGFPMHWFGSGEKANKASAGEMTMPTLKMLRARREYLVNCIKTMMVYVVDVAVRKGSLTEADRESMNLTLSVPELEDSKIASTSTAIAQVTAAVTLAVDNGWISSTVAKNVMALLLSNIGLDFKPEDDAEDLEKEIEGKEEREEESALAAQENARKTLAGEKANGGSGDEPDHGRNGDEPAAPAK